jgi:maltose alpha-D-glucosyltransferase/alpha-amylase
MLILKEQAVDPHWYKDAIIYETHVKAFFDRNGDGIGDFAGLIEKLDYLQDLGVTCLWLLPFFPSPLRDDGYDIADYTNVHPSYGTLDDFKTFLAAAHERNLRVIIELVINHTSDQHPWFQAARTAPQGTPERDVYVWSDTDKKYADARIIFTDTEKSNWTWDPLAKAYYWHRFFSHQPDLNFDSPEVINRVLQSMRFWLDMGVDGLRLDAIPYLVERDGTNCENLIETHAVIKRIRKEIDDRYQARLLLAEANQWPTDVRPYFGEGDECHMAFHFPVMPRIFMALRMEDRHPITDIMSQTPTIPETCQWGLFLRNHDELTLEMVTDDERDYMYFAYSADPKMKINVGIRRRLAPLMENDRRRIELLNSLMFSFPGTPIIYYGDEIGMGDNIYLGDRHGVRTPMQWSPDRNAGFSRANPAKLYSPVIMDPVYGYEAVNVESQLSDPSSLLHWMRNMIGVRKLFKVFGRGTIEFLSPQNRKVLAYVRRYQNDRILCVANLSRFAQAVELDLSHLAGMKLIEMFGYTEFPVIGHTPYALSLNPYGFFWFELHGVPEPPRLHSSNAPEVEFISATNWRELFESGTGEHLESHALPGFLNGQRWFAGKGKTIETVRIQDWTELQQAPFPTTLVLLRVRYSDGSAETYFISLSVASGARTDSLMAENPNRVLCRLQWNTANALLYESSLEDHIWRTLLDMIDADADTYSRRGLIRARHTAAFGPLRTDAGNLPAITLASGEQSNTSAFYGDRLMLKLYRKPEAGPNPDLEILRYLTENHSFDRSPSLAGCIEYAPFEGEVQTVGILESVIENQGTAWEWMLEELSRFYERCVTSAEMDRTSSAPGRTDTVESPIGTTLQDAAGLSLEAAATLGRRTAELHLALTKSDHDPAFAPEPFTPADLALVIDNLRVEAAHTFKLLRDNLERLPEDIAGDAEQLLRQQDRLVTRLQRAEVSEGSLLKTRIHGDYHLGQVLRVKNDYVIIDFEGEPGRSLSERRAKSSPLKDVAGMLRSFSYAAYAALQNYKSRRPEQESRLANGSSFWVNAMSSSFLESYSGRVQSVAFLPKSPSDLNNLIDLYVLEKALYELRYEINNRPAWIGVPLRAIKALME